jgi:hypothetical protein
MKFINQPVMAVILLTLLSACAHHQGYNDGYSDSNYSNSDPQQNRSTRGEATRNQNIDNHNNTTRTGRVRSE